MGKDMEGLECSVNRENFKLLSGGQDKRRKH